MSTAEIIQKQIKKMPKGKPFTSTTFTSLASRANVDQILCRLVKEEKLARVARGIFIRPQYAPYIGLIQPEPFAIAEAIAKNTGETIAPHGAEAARMLQLSTQVPLQPVFYTTGTSRHIKVGKIQVVLKHISPRKLVKVGTTAGLAISALWYLGKENMTLAVIQKLAARLSTEQFAELIQCIPQMPGWMADQFHQYQKSHHYE